MRVWMAVTVDEYELPIAIADTAKGLAKALGVSTFAVYQTQRREGNGQQLKKYAVRVVDCGEVAHDVRRMAGKRR